MTNPTPDQNTGGQASPPKKANDGGGDGLLTKIQKAAIDNYNGLYKIVLEPSMPRRYQVYLIIFGAILGLIWAWGLFPTQFTGANPNRLNQSAQEQWVKMVAIASSQDPLILYQDAQAVDLLSRIPDPIVTIDRLLADPNLSPGDAAALQELRATIPSDLQGTAAPGQNGWLSSIFQIVLLIVLIGVLTPIWMLLWRILIYPNIVAGAMDQFKASTNKEYAEQKKREAEVRAVARAAADAKRSMVVEADVDLGAPVMKTLSIFSKGREYDDSFEIELPLDQGGDFLGQCGATVAEAVTPDPVAIEIWLFDMFTSQDKKRVFITEAGYADPAIRSRVEASLDSPGDVVVARNGAKLIVDSDKLRLQGEMKDLQVDANGRFQSFQMPIAAWWRKDGAAAAPSPAPVTYAPPPTLGSAPSMATYDDIQFDPPPQAPIGGRSLSDYDDIQFDPPPVAPSGGRSLSDYDNIQLDPPPTMPGYQPLQPPPLQQQPLQPPPRSTGMQPLQPPPLRGNRPEDDDPFGNTGDFTPLGDD
jgi:hypothetical protein